MNYNFWKKAGIATGALGTIAIGGAVLANDVAPTVEVEEQFNNKRGVMQKLHKAHKFMNNEEVNAAIKNRDYDAFVQAITKENGNPPRILDTIVEENFSKFAEMHEAIQGQNFEKVQEIAHELGLPQIGQRGVRNGQPFHTSEEREAIRDAALNGDYETWYDLVAVDGELPEFLQVINAGNFDRYSEMHQLMGDAKQIREELGLEKPRMRRKMHKGMGIGQR